MYELDERRAAEIGFGDELAAVLLDKFGGTEETDDRIFAIGTLVCGVLGGRFIVKIVRILPDRLAVKALELMRKARYEDSRLPAVSWFLKFIPNQTVEESLAFLRMYPRGLHNAHALGTAALYVPAQFRLQALGLALDAQRKAVARRAILTQAGLLWDDRVTSPSEKSSGGS
jgi:hypothetical protein